ncbi:MAG: tail fiber protein, partial [Gammaproteobacteria bacterium]|nr:tail fiber protein [Gammaproteobacteria bacterium]
QTGGGGGGSATIGAIVAWANETVPSGWLECDGSPIPAQYADLIALVGTNTPDLRGEFVRGWDHGKGTDAGRSLLNNQPEGVNPASLTIRSGGSESGSTNALRFQGGLGNISNRADIVKGGNQETRPRNVALMYIINADGSSIGPGGGGNVINYNGAAAWGNVNADGTLANGLNCTTAVSSDGFGVDVTFNSPMPNDKYAITASTADRTSTSSALSYKNVTPNGFLVYVRNQAGSAAVCGFSFAVHSTNALPPKGGTGADAWAQVDSSGTLGGSFNIKSCTYTGPGTYLYEFTTPMPSADYAVLVSNSDATRSAQIRSYGETTTGFTVFGT